MVALHCTTRSTLAPLYSIWEGASNWCKGNRHWWAEFFPKFFLPRQCHRHQFSRVSLKIQSLVGITKHHGTRRSHLDCFNYFVWQDSNQNVTTFKELRFLTFFHAQKTIAESHRMLKDPLSRNCWSSVNSSQRFWTFQWKIAVCVTNFSQVCLQITAQRIIWSQTGSQNPPQMEIFCSQLYISCATTCAWPDVLLINLTSGAGKTWSLKIPPTSPKASFFSGSLAIWSHMSFGENWAKSSTTQELKSPDSRFRISPQRQLARCRLQLEFHLITLTYHLI